jgi:hypothetical protein
VYASGSRDEAVFADPDVFSPERANLRSHLASGGGPHHCVGAALARLELVIGLRRLPRLTLARARGPPARPLPPAAPAPLTGAVADRLSRTNDLYSAEKERDEGFNLVHVIRGIRGATMPEAMERAGQLLIARERMYREAAKAVRDGAGGGTARLLDCCDDLLAAVAPVREQRSRHS